ncbi:MAG: hypothetical protein JNK38_10075 [Acidobacteria bacterium]|nr:hypothetical protein [Acidobacteriota bacterium]
MEPKIITIGNSIMLASINPATIKAKELAKKLREFVVSEQNYPELAQRAQQLEEAIWNRLNIVEHPTPRIAFIAQKGVGKSTLINALAGLWLEETPPSADASSKQLNQYAMLPLGNGGTTPCEIWVEAGEWEVRVEPEEATDTQALIRQFAEWAWHKAYDPKKKLTDQSGPAEEFDSDLEESPISGRPPRLQLDIERVIRGITGLGKHPIPAGGAKAKKMQQDDAEDLAKKSFPVKVGFIAEVERLAHLAERKRLQWLPTGDERRWLQKTLLDLFQGKFKDQPFPKRVIIRTPSTGVHWMQNDLPLIDTLGLPAVSSGKADGESGSRPGHPLSERADLRELLKNPWTVIVVGSHFNNPPAPSVDLLQQMMEESVYFGESLEDRTVIAIVDPGKAGSGNFLTAEEEKAEKEDLCANNLTLLGCPRGVDYTNRWTVDAARKRICCVNVLDGGTELLQEFLQTAVESMVAAHETHLDKAVRVAEEFFRNLNNEKREVIRRDVITRFKNHLSAVAKKQFGEAQSFRSNLMRPFAEECRAVRYPSALHSVIVNRGRGNTQNAWAMIESATVRELERLLKPMRDEIDNISAALLAEEKYQDENGYAVIAEELDRRQRTINYFILSFTEELVQSAKKCLLEDTVEVWSDSEGEWGRGIKNPGYKERVARHFENWGITYSPDLMVDLLKVKEYVNIDETGLLRTLTETRSHHGV